ncbi:hypothetical protein PT286_00150 [Neisseriaceae bacterium ESL0693]|nr:hypothetical protein [Neisseriaceae bacterium ESL0693]
MAKPKLKDRKTTSSNNVGSRKTDIGSTQGLKLVFSFEYMRSDHHCIKCCHNSDADNSFHLLNKIRKLSELTWAQINTTHRHGLGAEKIPYHQIKESIPYGLTEDTTFLAFRCIGKAPMIGFRDGQIFHIIWIDYDYEIYDHA